MHLFALVWVVVPSKWSPGRLSQDIATHYESQERHGKRQHTRSFGGNHGPYRPNLKQADSPGAIPFMARPSGSLHDASEDEFPGQQFNLPSQCIPQHEVADVFTSELQVSTLTVQGIWSHLLQSSILGGAYWKLRGWESEKSVNTYEDSAR
ncbi:hypothetical protein B0H14DRAFT_2650598 [Mycena olivaceomarginata]|nr:hypothetical protein B0H14DRAFT_2650598 [Mycena olivaceomarginata]